MASRPRMNVQSFPRPPSVEKTDRHLVVKWGNTVIADTKDGIWVKETHHPPTYYIPVSSLTIPLQKTSRSSYCEWKGAASYYAITNPSNPSDIQANRIWGYDNPNKRFASIKDHVSFYVEPWDCFVDGEKVEPQPGDFYGGWVTGELDGIIKGRNGNWDPVV